MEPLSSFFPRQSTLSPPSPLKRPAETYLEGALPTKQPKVSQKPPSHLEVIFNGLAFTEWGRGIPPVAERNSNLDSLSTIVDKSEQFVQKHGQNQQFATIVSKCLTFAQRDADTKSERSKALELCQVLTTKFSLYTFHFRDRLCCAITQVVMEKLIEQSDYFKAIVENPLREKSYRRIDFLDDDCVEFMRCTETLAIRENSFRLVASLDFKKLWRWHEKRLNEHGEAEPPLPQVFKVAIHAGRFQYRDFPALLDKCLQAIFMPMSTPSFWNGERHYCGRAASFQRVIDLCLTIKAFLDLWSLHYPLFNAAAAMAIAYAISEQLLKRKGDLCVDEMPLYEYLESLETCGLLSDIISRVSDRLLKKQWPVDDILAFKSLCRKYCVDDSKLLKYVEAELLENLGKWLFINGCDPERLRFYAQMLSSGQMTLALKNWLVNGSCKDVTTALEQFLFLKPLLETYGIDGLNAICPAELNPQGLHVPPLTYKELFHRHLQSELNRFCSGKNAMDQLRLLQQMNECQLSNLVLFTPVKGLKILTNLRSLKIERIYSFSKKFLKEIAHLQALETLSLLPGGNKDVITADLLKGLKPLSQLRHLLLNRCRLNPAELVAIFPQLERISIGSNLYNCLPNVQTFADPQL
jgi:hypothetical protein